MPEIALLSQETIDKIAAGEVVERPSSVVKELVENAIDAGATAVTVEIREGGISFIRITDNGCGIARAQIPIAFLRHSTSKIRGAEDLFRIRSLGFRGEALSSIAAVSQVELITKVYGELTGTRYVMEGAKEVANEEVGAPDGTTFIVRNLFYNMPARRKFLKSAQTEGSYIGDLMERLALSHPGISFQFINNGQTKLHTSGNSNEKDLVYHIYGRDITAALILVDAETELFSVRGFLGKPMVSRGNRNYENFFVNGRYIRSNLFSKAVEEAYKGFLMQRQYPFCVLHVRMDTELLDVNVHPTKMELRFSRNEEVYRSLYDTVRGLLSRREMIPEAPVGPSAGRRREGVGRPENAVGEGAGRPGGAESRGGPVHTSAGLSSFLGEKELIQIRQAVAKDSPYEPRYPGKKTDFGPGIPCPGQPGDSKDLSGRPQSETGKPAGQTRPGTGKTTEQDLPENLGVFQSLLPKRSTPAESGSYAATGQTDLMVSEPGIAYGPASAGGDSESGAGRRSAGAESESGTVLPPAGVGDLSEPGRRSAGTESESGTVLPPAGVGGLSESGRRSAGAESDAGRPSVPQMTAEPGRRSQAAQNQEMYEQQSLSALDAGFLTEEARKRHRIIGQLFDTYWLVEYEDKLFVIDQHAAHEKVLYERTMARVRKNEFTSQAVSPPVILTLSLQEQEVLERYRDQITSFGYEIEPFGGKEYAVTAMPADFESVDMKSMFVEMLGDFSGISGHEAPELILEKVASLSCKAAVKGGSRLSRAEAETLIDELLTLENPYHCPHGRPTIVSMSRYEIEKKFKRIVN